MPLCRSPEIHRVMRNIGLNNPKLAGALDSSNLDSIR